MAIEVASCNCNWQFEYSSVSPRSPISIALFRILKHDTMKKGRGAGAAGAKLDGDDSEEEVWDEWDEEGAAGFTLLLVKLTPADTGEGMACVDLFSSHSESSPHALVEHMRVVHSFDLPSVCHSQGVMRFENRKLTFDCLVRPRHPRVH